MNFDAEAAFDEDYLYFYEPRLTERSDREAALIAAVLDLLPGQDVLDLACGHGRIANRLALRGCRVTGLDVTPLFLERARQDAAALGVDVEYLRGDMRDQPWTERFDAVIIWFTAFGYFDDADNRRVLAEAYRALRPGGRLLLDLNHRDPLLRVFHPAGIEERDGDFLLDKSRYDLETGRIQTERIVIRDGRTRRFEFFVRLFPYYEIRAWLLDAGFARVDAYDHDGAPLTLESRRMVIVAQK